VKRVYIETYGCTLNKSDSQLMVTLLLREGYSIVGSASEADVIILNTCTVRRDSEERMLRRVRALSRLDGKKLVIAGCMASAQPFTLRVHAPRAVLIGTDNVHRITEAVSAPDSAVFLEPRTDKRAYLPCYKDGVMAAVPLSDGCLNSCSFCITVRARPRLLSRDPKRVVEVIRELVSQGVYEIQLTGQDLAVYGMDLAGKQLLPELLESILCAVEGNYAIRIGMMTPGWFYKIMDKMLEFYRDRRMYKFFHLPLESGDNRVLRIMKRNYTVEEYVSMVREIRRKIEDPYIATDIIVGHPGEDKEAFANTLRVVEELELDRIHVAQYTPRPFTLSARMKQVPNPVKKERSKTLMQLYEKIGLKRNRRYLNKTVSAVVVERVVRRGTTTFVARTQNYNSIVIVGGREPMLGERVQVHIVDCTFYDLRGTIE